jgi:hypothetical protein
LYLLVFLSWLGIQEYIQTMYGKHYVSQYFWLYLCCMHMCYATCGLKFKVMVSWLRLVQLSFGYLLGRTYVGAAHYYLLEVASSSESVGLVTICAFMDLALILDLLWSIKVWDSSLRERCAYALSVNIYVPYERKCIQAFVYALGRGLWCLIYFVGICWLASAFGCSGTGLENSDCKTCLFRSSGIAFRVAS